MHTPSRRRLGLCLACAVALSPLFGRAAEDKKKEAVKAEVYSGKVVPLADLVAKTGSKLDPDAVPVSLVLVADDGKVYSLIKDGGSRLFFTDPTLLNRPMRLTAKALPGSQVLRVLSVRSVKKGQLYEIYYWCDVCAIRRGEKMSRCECCGGPMELHEEPVK
jgi:hypothetical protein